MTNASELDDFESLVVDAIEGELHIDVESAASESREEAAEPVHN